jgi:hypothetical protein
MSAITFTKLTRLQERIRVTVRHVPLRCASISIFVKDASGCGQALMQPRADPPAARNLEDLRADVSRANAECGISGLLGERAPSKSASHSTRRG